MASVMNGAGTTATGPLLNYRDSNVGIVNDSFSFIREVTTNDEVNLNNMVCSVNNTLSAITAFPPVFHGDNYHAIFSNARGIQRANTYGAGPFVFGYIPTFSANPVNNEITPDDFIKGQNIIRGICNHLGVTLRPGMVENVAAGDVIRAETWNDLLMNCRDCWENRFDGWKSATAVNGSVQNFLALPSSASRAVSFRYDFNDVNALRRFFLLGGAIGVRFVSENDPGDLLGSARDAYSDGIRWQRLFGVARDLRLSMFSVGIGSDNGIRYGIIEDGLTVYAFPGIFLGVYDTDNHMLRVSDGPTFHESSNFVAGGGLEDRSGQRARAEGFPGTRFNINAGIFTDNGYASVVIEVVLFRVEADIGFDDLGVGVSSKCWTTTPPWGISADGTVSYTSGFPVITSHSDFLHNTPLSFRQP